MPIQNDFLPFAVGSGANVESQTSWVSDSVVAQGFQAGLANSAQANKVLRQATIIAAMIAQFIVDKSGQPAIDDGTTATLETNLTASINALITAFAANALGSGGTIYTPQFASVMANALDASGNGGQFRLTQGGYGVFFRNDGTNLYILLTNSGSPSGSFNALRPFIINLATGAVSIDATGVGSSFGATPTAPTMATGDNSTHLATTAFVKAQNYQAALGYTPVHQGGGASQLSNNVFIGWDGTGVRVQVDSTDLGDIALKSYFPASLAAGGYQQLSSGLILQWGVITDMSSWGQVRSFPLAFPNSCFAICANDNGSGNDSNSISLVATSASQFACYAVRAYDDTSWGQHINSSNIQWIAVGH